MGNILSCLAAMMRRLKQQDQALLADIVGSRSPQLRPALERFPHRLSTDERSAFQDMLAEELMASGFLQSGEPTERGLAIEELIDHLLPYMDGRARDV